MADGAIVYRPAWRRKDADIERDARAFWIKLNLLPANADASVRLAELCAAAYVDGQMIAVSTAPIREVDFVRCRLAMFRCAVDPDFRRRRIATQIGVYSRLLLEAWALENPGERLMGMGTVVQSADLNERDARRSMLRSTQLGLVGFTDAHEPIRIAWFDHGVLPEL